MPTKFTEREVEVRNEFENKLLELLNETHATLGSTRRGMQILSLVMTSAGITAQHHAGRSLEQVLRHAQTSYAIDQRYRGEKETPQ